MTDRNRERAERYLRENVSSKYDPEPLTALLDEVERLRSGAAIKAALDAVVLLTRERDEARAELRRLTDMAGDWIETDPSLRSSACIEIALDHAKELDAEVERLRAKLQRVRDAIKFMANLDSGLVAEIDGVLSGGEK